MKRYKYLIMLAIVFAFFSCGMLIAIKQENEKKEQYQNALVQIESLVSVISSNSKKCIESFPEFSNDSWSRLTKGFFDLDEKVRGILFVDYDENHWMLEDDLNALLSFVDYVNILKQQPKEVQYSCLQSISTASDELLSAFEEYPESMEITVFMQSFSQFVSHLQIPE